VGQKSWDKNAEAGQLRQESLGCTAKQDSRRKWGWYRKDKKRGQDGQNMTEGKATGTGQLRWDSHGRTVMTVKVGHDIWDMTSTMKLDRTAQTGQSGQDRRTGQVRQDI
jgi:hypothetical protein